MSEILQSTILAVDTSTAACSVALIIGDRVFSKHEILPQKHAHRVLEMVDEVLSEAKVDGKNIDLLAYGEGPGAFTGIRIASGVIQGLALGWDKPVLAVSSLLSMVDSVILQRNVSQDMSWSALLDARMSEVYLLTGTYQAAEQRYYHEAPRLISPDKAKGIINSRDNDFGVGDIEQEYPELAECFAEWVELYPNAVSIARLARLSDQEAISLEEGVPNPLYLRNNVAETIEQRRLKKASR